MKLNVSGTHTISRSAGDASLPVTYVTVTHQLTTRPINAHGLDSVSDQPFDDVAAPVLKG